MVNLNGPYNLWACSLVGAGAGLGWLVLIFYERKTLLAGWFGLAKTNKRTGCLSGCIACCRLSKLVV